jgi:hypothetical protein
MSSLEQLDLILGDSLECLVKATNEAKSIEIDGKNKILMKFGRIIAEIWEIRNHLYKLDHSLKPDLVRESEQDRERYKELTLIQNRAYESEQKGDKESASNLYNDLLKRSQYGYFRRIAEAGLYRVRATK